MLCFALVSLFYHIMLYNYVFIYSILFTYMFDYTYIHIYIVWTISILYFKVFPTDWSVRCSWWTLVDLEDTGMILTCIDKHTHIYIYTHTHYYIFIRFTMEDLTGMVGGCPRKNGWTPHQQIVGKWYEKQ
jgi:hypothetical protein